jgi:transcriptional regulator with XRE-family HTH domain
MDQTALGKYFHDYRTERHISMQDAAIGLTKSTISRFERGLTDLSTATASQLMYNIGMDAYSLAEALQNTDHELPDLADAVVTGDFNAIKQAVEDYVATHNTRNADLLTSLVSATEENVSTLPRHLEQRVADALAYPQTWGKVEFAVITLALPRASVELVKLVLTRIFSQIDHNLPLIIKPLAFACVLAVSRTGNALYDLIRPAMCDLVSKQNYALNVNEYAPYIRATDALVNGKDPQPIIDATRMWHATAIADFLTHQLEKQSDIHHNSVLKDTSRNDIALDETKPLLNGANLVRIRNQRGLTIDDVSTNWSTSAQSRFEHGKTELGFTRCLTLLSTLEIDIDMLAHTSDLPNSYSRAKSEILSVCDTEPIAVSQFEKIIDAYKHFNGNRPAGLVAIEMFALRRTALTYTIDHHPELMAEIPHNITADQQDDIVEYVANIEQLSVRDVDMITIVLGELDAPHTDTVLSAVIHRHLQNKYAIDKLLKNALLLADGPIYYQNWPLVGQINDFFDHLQHSKSSWNQCLHRTGNQLHYQAHIHPTEAMRQRLGNYLDALQIVYPHPTNGYSMENWLAFAMDGNYHHFDS